MGQARIGLISTQSEKTIQNLGFGTISTMGQLPSLELLSSTQPGRRGNLHETRQEFVQDGLNFVDDPDGYKNDTTWLTGFYLLRAMGESGKISHTLQGLGTRTDMSNPTVGMFMKRFKDLGLVEKEKLTIPRHFLARHIDEEVYDRYIANPTNEFRIKLDPDGKPVYRQQKFYDFIREKIKKSMFWRDFELYELHREHNTRKLLSIDALEEVQAYRIPSFNVHVTDSTIEPAAARHMKKWKGIYEPEEKLIKRFRADYPCVKNEEHDFAVPAGRSLIGFTSTAVQERFYWGDAERRRSQEVDLWIPVDPDKQDTSLSPDYRRYELTSLPIYRCPDCRYSFVPRNNEGWPLAKKLEHDGQPITLGYLVRNHRNPDKLPAEVFTQ